MKRLVPFLMASTLVVYFGCSQAVRYAAGAEKGQCYGNQTCNSGLSCDSNICVRSTSSSTGGSSGSGGEGASGGQSGSNDTSANSGLGGTPSSGGAAGSGGDTASGGNQGSGGSMDTGGAQASGGSLPAGGASGSGGTTTTSTNTCGASTSTTVVTICNGLAVGAMTGYGWVALGSADTLTDPTCDVAKAAITAATPCKANTNWGKPDALCMSGSVPALPGDAGAADYSSNWGVQIGVNAKDPNAGMGTSWKTITFTMSGSPSTGLRAVIHKNGDPDSTGYCVSMTPGTALKITDFNSACWDSSGTSLTEADAASIDKVSVQVTSTASAITVDHLCLTKVELGN